MPPPGIVIVEERRFAVEISGTPGCADRATKKAVETAFLR